MRLVYLFIFCCFTTFNLQSQLTGVCGTQDIDLITRDLLENKRIYAEQIYPRSALKYVPVTFHLVADDNGNGRIVEENILSQLCALNTLYADQDMIFYIDRLSYANHSILYNTPTHPAAQFQMTSILRDPNSANVFVLNSAENGGSTPGTTLGYYSRQHDHIVIRKDQTNAFTGTLGHEFGHFFSLLHTFNGWDCEPYDEDTHGNPLNSQWAPCPSGTTGLSILAELQARTNCESAGDYLCDTPADYNFGFGWSPGGDQCAPYTANTKDFNGEIVDPMENNTMGYFLNCDDYQFTPDQKAVMETDFFKPNRAYLRTGNTPENGDVDANISYIEPINDITTATFTNVLLDWENVDNANSYLVIIDRLPNFNNNPQRFLVNESQLIIEELEGARKYFWKVWPFNETRTCAGWSQTQSFTTGTSTAVDEITLVSSFSIYPNPTDGEHTINLDLTTANDFEAQISLIDLHGKQVANFGMHMFYQNGQEGIQLDVNGVAAGLYIIHLQSQEGVLSRKLIIQ